MNQPFAITSFLASARRGSPLLFWSAIAMTLVMAMCLVLPFWDLRQFNGVSTWEKPAKFGLSFVVHFATVAWGMSLLTPQTRGAKTASILMFAAAWFEIVYIVFRASRGEGSHFNSDTFISGLMYGMMGMGALLLTATTAFIGWRIFQQRTDSLMLYATGLGFMLGALLGTIGGGHLSSQPSHWIGGDMTDATGLFFFHWSTTGGDLRVSHFIGLHAIQFVPLAGLSENKAIVWGAAAGVALAMAATFAMALMGIPLFKLS
jgi:hypothetical protein